MPGSPHEAPQAGTAPPSASQPGGAGAARDFSEDSAAGEDRALLGDNKALARIRSRRTTDVCCLVAFCCLWAAVLATLRNALRDGNPNRLFHGFDYHGSLCGVDEDVREQPLIYWPDPTAPSYPICIDRCPTDANSTVPFPVERVTSTQTDNITVVIEIVKTEEMRATYNSTLVGGIFCLPAYATEAAKEAVIQLRERVAQGEGPLMLAFKDLCSAWMVLLFVAPLSVAVGYAYFYLLRYCARLLTYGILGTLLALAGGVAAYCLWLAPAPTQEDRLWGTFFHDPVARTRVIGWAAAAAFVILLCFVCCMRASLQRALGCVEAACDAMWALPHMLLMPVIELCTKSFFVLLWLFFLAWVLTNGVIRAPEAEVNGTPVHGLVFQFTHTWQQRCGIAVYLFGLFWGLETTTVLFQFVGGHAVAVWYFTPCRPDLSKRPVSAAVWGEGLWHALRYHLGSVALGAALVSCFRLTAALCGYVTRQARGENKVAAAIGHIFMCCVWCYEEVVRFINKNAIIEMVLRSTDFFTSAGRAFRRVERALPEAAALNGITVLFQVLGSIVMTGIGGYTAFLLVSGLSMYSDPSSQWYLESPLFVVVANAGLAFLISAVFMTMFDMTSDTLLFCWLTDTEDGVAEFAPKPLRNLVGPPLRGEAAHDAADF